MIIDCISDLHGCKPALHGGDLLIVAGDLTARDTHEQYVVFQEWLDKQPYSKKVVIAGNHDGRMVKTNERHMAHVYCHGADYLCDSGTEFCGTDKDGKPCTMKIWGSPWTPTFYDWYFMKDRGASIKEMWDKIPKDIDILITHGPPYGILDKTVESQHVGCMDLLNKVVMLKNLKLHVFGHIHECPGVEEIDGTKFVNATIMNEWYEPVNKPIRIDL